MFSLLRPLSLPTKARNVHIIETKIRRLVSAFRMQLWLTSFLPQQATARTLFAFSRDRLVPGSRLWTKINPVTQTPIYAVWGSVVSAIALNLIGLGSYTAITGVFNVTAIALDWSYVIPIFCKLIYGQFEPGPWHMGKASFFVNAWACIWTFFVSIIFILPTVRPVTAVNVSCALVNSIFEILQDETELTLLRR
jgi:amino acid transporter